MMTCPGVVRRVVSLEADLTRTVRPALIAFAIAAVIVLIVACSNVATILIGRTASRQRELAVRRALGASPFRLGASVLSESIVIFGYLAAFTSTIELATGVIILPERQTALIAGKPQRSRCSRTNGSASAWASAGTTSSTKD
jgi:hypothetical protein